MKVVFIYVWTIVSYILVTLIFLISAPIGLFLTLISPSSFFFFTFYLARLIAFLLGVRTIIQGNFPKDDDTYIYISNHSSYLDPVFTTYLIKKKHKYLGKAEILSWPIFGFVVKKYLIPVKREEKKSRSNSMDLMKETLFNGYSIVLYPEGGWKDDHQKHPYDIKPNSTLNQFRNGAFRLSIETNKKIVPISLSNIQKIHSSDSMMFSPGKVVLNIHDPIDPEGLTSSDEDVMSLNKKCYSIIYNDLIKYDYRKKRI